MRPKEPERDEPPFPPGTDAEEATVMFVTREPAPGRPSAIAPADLGSDHESAPPGRLNLGAGDPPGLKGALDTPYPPAGEIEEAEVTIVTADAIKERQETAQRDGNLRRFRKALLGE